MPPKKIKEDTISSKEDTTSSASSAEPGRFKPSAFSTPTIFDKARKKDVFDTSNPLKTRGQIPRTPPIQNRPIPPVFVNPVSSPAKPSKEHLAPNLQVLTPQGGAIQKGTRITHTSRGGVKGSILSTRQLTNKVEKLNLVEESMAEAKPQQDPTDPIDPSNLNLTTDEGQKAGKAAATQEFVRYGDKLGAALILVDLMLDEDTVEAPYNFEIARNVTKLHDELIQLNMRLAQVVYVLQNRFQDTSLKNAFTQYNGQYKERRVKIFQYLHKKPVEDNPPQANAPQQIQVPAALPQPKTRSPPRPERLSNEANPFEFADWTNRMKTFLRYNDSLKEEREDQKEILKVSLDKDLSDMISADQRLLAIYVEDNGEENQGQQEETWLGLLDKYFLRRHPMENRRMEVARLTKHDGECDSNYIRRVVRQCNIGNVHRNYMEVEDLVRAIICVNIDNPHLRSKLVKMEGAHLHEIQNTADDEDNTFSGDYTYLPTKSTTPKPQGKNAPRQATSNQGANTFRSTFNSNQKNPNQTQYTPKKCNFCKKLGHIERECNTKKKMLASLIQAHQGENNQQQQNQTVSATKTSGATGSVPYDQA